MERRDTRELMERSRREVGEKLRRPSGGGNFRYPGWITESGDYYRLFPGEYGPNKLPVYIHPMIYVPMARDGKGATIVCNCQGGKVKKPCVPHWKIAKDEKAGGVDPKDGRKKKSALFMVYNVAVNAVHLWPYHKVPKTGQGGKVYFQWKPCTGAEETCEHCKAGLELRFGNPTYLDLSASQWKMIESFDRDISRTCMHPTDEGWVKCPVDGKVGPYEAYCSSCGEKIPNPGPKILVAMETEDAQCPHCGVKDKAILKYRCQKRDPNRPGMYLPGCENTYRPSIYDANLEMKKVVTSSSENGRMRKKTTLQMVGFDVCDPDDTIQVLMQDPIKFGEFLDFMAPEKQAEIMGIANPYAGGYDSTEDGGGSSGTATSDEPDTLGTEDPGVVEDDFPF